MTRHRASLLSGQWRQDATDRLTACHFFELAARHEVAPAALCGLTPASVAEATTLHFTTANYAPSKADCLDCRRAIGEDPRDDYGRRTRA